MRARVTFTAGLLLAACGPRDRVSDPIDGVPLAHQQTISRGQLGFRWPLSPGIGTLACAGKEVILFRAAGVTYVVQGDWPGAADISPLRVSQPAPLPSNPVKRLPQNIRMDAFASLERCRSNGADDTCSRGVQERFRMSAEEAQLIEAEGEERRWPPLARGLMPLGPLIAAGRGLCDR
jgi:hypothetical protein